VFTIIYYEEHHSLSLFITLSLLHMQRRLALKQMAIALGGIITVPQWAYGWNSQTLPLSTATLFPPELETLLSEAVETIIPATDTPGAKELGVDKFILTMLKDCYDKQAQDKFSSGLQTIDERARKDFGNAFTACVPAQRNQLLTALDKEGPSSAFSMIKNLTVQGYLNSEYVMKNLLKYELIPARYHGCVPASN
jgi:hypothetical protein